MTQVDLRHGADQPIFDVWWDRSHVTVLEITQRLQRSKALVMVTSSIAFGVRLLTL